MNRKISIAVLAAAAMSASIFAVSPARASDDKAAEHADGPRCPLMDEPIDPSVFTATDDGPVYFCCPGCIEKYEKNTKKYDSKVAAQRAEVAKMAKVQVICPVSDKPVDAKITTEYEGQKVSFCRSKCKGRFEADPAAFKAKLANSYTIQTKCPFSGDPIEPNAFAKTTSGQRVYFCCEKCTSKYKANPEKFEKKLAAMNIMIDPKKVEKGS